MTYIRCKISPGAFSGELQFEITLNGSSHNGLASRRYFFSEGEQPIGQVTAPTDGLIVCRILTKENEKVLVSIPDGDVIKVKPELLVSKEPPNVSLGSRSAVGC